MLLEADGFNVETFRLRNWLTAEECASKAGISVDTLIGMEKGAVVTPRSVHKVAEALGVAPEELARPVERRASLRIVA